MTSSSSSSTSTESYASDPDVLLSEPLIRAEQVAELLAVKRSTIYELTRRRHNPLPYVRIGRSKRFSRHAVARWAAAQVNM